MVATGKTSPPKKISARWSGEPPAIGEYLQSQLRPRGAYRIVSVVERPSGMLDLLVDRVENKDVPSDAVVHAWKWDPRTKVGAAWSSHP